MLAAIAAPILAVTIMVQMVIMADHRLIDLTATATAIAIVIAVAVAKAATTAITPQIQTVMAILKITIEIIQMVETIVTTTADLILLLILIIIMATITIIIIVNPIILEVRVALVLKKYHH